MNTNWLLAQGLVEHGYGEIAQTIGERSRELVARHGFNEFYDPLDGSPVGEPQVRLGDARRRHARVVEVALDVDVARA